MFSHQSQAVMADAPCAPAEKRSQSAAGEPIVLADWQPALFLHYEIDPRWLRALLPLPFELELYRDKAFVSLVALTMRRFRPAPGAPVWAKCLRALSEQRFFNLRTYVKYRSEPGTFFFWSWLSRPWGLALPARPFGLTCGFAKSHCLSPPKDGKMSAMIGDQSGQGRFAFEARIEPGRGFDTCPSDSLAEFTLERYSGYFWHCGEGRAFRARHSPWLQGPVEARIQEDSLVVRAFPWFESARFVAAHYAPGVTDVGIGRPLRLVVSSSPRRTEHHGPSAFYRMP